MDSISAGDGVSGRAARLVRRGGCSGGSAPNKEGASVAASGMSWFGTVGAGSTEGSGAPSESVVLRGGRVNHTVKAGGQKAVGVRSDLSKP